MTAHADREQSALTAGGTRTGGVGDRQLRFDDLPDMSSGRTVATIASVLTADLARIAVRVTEFWRSVSMRGDDECWPWTGYVNEDGYGEFFFVGKMRGAHELAVTFTTGEVKDPGLDTCHSCDNPPCCNPRHLRFGTRLENVADMIERGRMRTGSRHPFAKLTEAMVVEIRVPPAQRRHAEGSCCGLRRQRGVQQHHRQRNHLAPRRRPDHQNQ